MRLLGTGRNGSIYNTKYLVSWYGWYELHDFNALVLIGDILGLDEVVKAVGVREEKILAFHYMSYLHIKLSAEYRTQSLPNSFQFTNTYCFEIAFRVL